MLIKKFSLNQLTIRTFTVFWLAFFAMTALLVALPYFDSRLYSDLNQNEISSYQKKLVESIRNNRINGILAGVPVLNLLILILLSNNDCVRLFAAIRPLGPVL